ncbi:helix-turn-helix domain-containing protein [Actinoplanes lobatus]
MRGARGLSLRELSRIAPLDPGHLSKIENGHRTPTADVAKALDRALQARGELVTLAHLERSARARQAVPFDPMRRRSLLALGVTATAIASAGPANKPHGPKIGIADARELQDTAAWLYGLDYQHGGATLWRAAKAAAQDGHDMLENGIYGEVVERQIIKGTSRLQMCAGWLAFDAGRHDLARSCYTEALALARQVGDAEVEIHALSNLAFQANVLGRPREAMRFVEGAIRAESAPHDQARLPAIPHLRRSVALSLSNDRTGHEKAMGAARKILDRDHDKPAEEWCSFLSPAELDGVEGTCLVELGQPKRAGILLECAIRALDQNYARNRALYRARLARARLDSKLVDGAVEAADAALDDLDNQVASWRVESELAAVATRLARFPHDGPAKDFLDRYHSRSQEFDPVRRERRP